MNQIPELLELALETDVGHLMIVLEPVARRVLVITPDGDTCRHRIDLYDGLSPRVMVDSKDVTLDVCFAIGRLLTLATSVAVDYEQAARSALGTLVERSWTEVPYTKIATRMSAHVDGLRSLCTWHKFLVALNDRRRKRAGE